jgi:hypothetical protein
MAQRISQMGHKQTFSDLCPMSALLPRADIPRRRLDVRFGPRADICNAKSYVRFAPESEHSAALPACQLRANRRRHSDQPASFNPPYTNRRFLPISSVREKISSPANFEFCNTIKGDLTEPTDHRALSAPEKRYRSLMESRACYTGKCSFFKQLCSLLGCNFQCSAHSIFSMRPPGRYQDLAFDAVDLRLPP